MPILPSTIPGQDRPLDFVDDHFPDKPRLLFIGAAESSHARSWVDLLAGAEVNVRMFAMPTGLPPVDWPVRTYVTSPLAEPGPPETRVSLHSPLDISEKRPGPDLDGEPVQEEIAAPGESRNFSEKVKDKLLQERIAKYSKAQEAHARAEQEYNQAKLAYQKIVQAHDRLSQTVRVNQRWLAGAVHHHKMRDYRSQSPANRMDPVWRENFDALGREELWLPHNAHVGCYLPFKNLRRTHERGGLAGRDHPRVAAGRHPHPSAWMTAPVFSIPCANRSAWRKSASGCLQTRGGSDLTLAHAAPHLAEPMREMLAGCHTVITDNRKNFEYLAGLGVPPEKLSPLCPIPGAGGVDIAALSEGAPPPSKRERSILCPKAYESAWSKFLPVLEGIRLAWPEIAPCRLDLLACDPEVELWLRARYPEIAESCVFHERIPAPKVLELMRSARVMLAPSLVDGGAQHTVRGHGLRRAAGGVAFGDDPVRDRRKRKHPVGRKPEPGRDRRRSETGRAGRRLGRSSGKGQFGMGGGNGRPREAVRQGGRVLFSAFGRLSVRAHPGKGRGIVLSACLG